MWHLGQILRSFLWEKSLANSCSLHNLANLVSTQNHQPLHLILMKVNFKRNIILRGSWINVNILIKLLDCSPFCSRFTDTEEKADICYNCICDICDKSVLLWNTYLWHWHCVWSNPAGSYFSQTRCTVLWQVWNMSPPLLPAMLLTCRPLHASLVPPDLPSCLTSASHKFNNFGRSISKSLRLILGLHWRVSGSTRH